MGPGGRGTALGCGWVTRCVRPLPQHGGLLSPVSPRTITSVMGGTKQPRSSLHCLPLAGFRGALWGSGGA